MFVPFSVRPFWLPSLKCQPLPSSLLYIFSFSLLSLSNTLYSPGLNPQTSLKPESRAKIGFDNFILPEVPDVKPQASLSIDPYDSEEVDFEDLDRRLEILKKTT
uniref:Uncharacterized protein n=1 Tax=Equus asinus asinus TaxID=83772 RepID=A0A8C4M2A0_EQUAS